MRELAIVKEILKLTFNFFCIITTIQVITIAVLAPDTVVNSQILIGIIITSFAGVFPSIIVNVIFNLYTIKMSRMAYFFMRGIHFIITIILVLISLNHFGMLRQNNIIRVITVFLFIYIMSSIASEVREKKAAAELNKRINATHQD